MGKRHVKILVLAIGAMMLLTGALPCWAKEKEAEKEEESVWHEDEERGEGFRRGLELTDEMIEHMMSRLAESDPAKAKELAKLREKDAEKFKAELREVMREQFGRRWGEHRKGAGRYEPGRGKGFEERDANVQGEFRPTKRLKGERAAFRRRGMGMTMRERHLEFFKWLAKNYEEKSKELTELVKKGRSELYDKRIAFYYRRYRKIFEARDNPELVEILKEDLELKEKRDELLVQIKAGVSEDEKKELVKELEEVLGQRFDLIVKRKQIEYENLLKKLAELQERVEESEAQVEKWKEAEFKETSVKGRVEELVGKAEKFRWD